MFKEIFTESVEADSNNVYWDKDTSRWGIEPWLNKFGRRYGKLKAVFVTADNARNGKMNERWCFDSNDTEFEDFPNPGSGYEIMRYVSLSSASGGMAPVCAINPKTGKVRFLKDLDTDPEDAKWDRPLKVQYMRYVK
jgi:hypothetical protein